MSIRIYQIRAYTCRLWSLNGDCQYYLLAIFGYGEVSTGSLFIRTTPDILSFGYALKARGWRILPLHLNERS